jgi:hypothetical protein
MLENHKQTTHPSSHEPKSSATITSLNLLCCVSVQNSADLLMMRRGRRGYVAKGMGDGEENRRRCIVEYKWGYGGGLSGGQWTEKIY